MKVHFRIKGWYIQVKYQRSVKAYVDEYSGALINAIYIRFKARKKYLTKFMNKL